MTTPERLLAWLDNPAATRGISFAQAGQAWDFWSYARLADAACRVAETLIEDGIRDDDVAVIILPTHPEFVATFFGALLAGAIPCPVAPVTAVQSDDAYARYLMGILAAARAAYVVTSDASMASIAAVPAGAARIVTAAQLLDASGAPRVRRRPPSLALLQFTSGSTAESRGVRIPFGALEANVQAIRQWLEWREDDAFASWLPLHHDMGLIGALIASIISRSNLWLMQPEQFVRSPARYLRCFGESGATLSVTASFALDHIVRRVNPASLSRCDFSRWRSVVVGAERIDPVSLERLVALLSPFGFRQRTLRPAYGLAEATLAVTGVPAGREWTTVRVQPESLSQGSRVAVADAGGVRLVGCGRCLDGVSVSIVDDQHRPLQEGHVGEIRVKGSSVAAGYISREAPSFTTLENGTLDTADAGFLLDGELFVIGRLGDSLKVRGRVVFAEDVELAIAAAGIPRRRVVALLGTVHGEDTCAALVENCSDQWRSRVESTLRSYAQGARSIVIDAPNGAILRTPSGKPRRRQLWQQFLERMEVSCG